RILLAVCMGGGKFDVEAGGLEQPLLNADDHRQIENLVIGSDVDDGPEVGHGVLSPGLLLSKPNLAAAHPRASGNPDLSQTGSPLGGGRAENGDASINSNGWVRTAQATSPGRKSCPLCRGRGRRARSSQC